MLFGNVSLGDVHGEPEEAFRFAVRAVHCISSAQHPTQLTIIRAEEAVLEFETASIFDCDSHRSSHPGTILWMDEIHERVVRRLRLVVHALEPTKILRPGRVAGVEIDVPGPDAA